MPCNDAAFEWVGWTLVHHLLWPPDASGSIPYLEYPLATLAQLGAIFLQTFLNRAVVAHLFTAKTLCVSRASCCSCGVPYGPGLTTMTLRSLTDSGEYGLLHRRVSDISPGRTFLLGGRNVLMVAAQCSNSSLRNSSLSNSPGSSVFKSFHNLPSLKRNHTFAGTWLGENS